MRFTTIKAAPIGVILNMKRKKDLFEEGMDWDKFAELDLPKTPSKLRRVLGDEYHEAIEMGMYPYNYFVSEYLDDFMHRAVLMDPDHTVELEQLVLIPLASNPEGEFCMRPKKRIPEKLRIWYCHHKNTGKHITWRQYEVLDKKEKTNYDRYYEQFSKREIFTLLRFSAEWNTTDIEQQEAILDYLKQKD